MNVVATSSVERGMPFPNRIFSCPAVPARRRLLRQSALVRLCVHRIVVTKIQAFSTSPHATRGSRTLRARLHGFLFQSSNRHSKDLKGSARENNTALINQSGIRAALPPTSLENLTSSDVVVSGFFAFVSFLGFLTTNSISKLQQKPKRSGVGETVGAEDIEGKVELPLNDPWQEAHGVFLPKSSGSQQIKLATWRIGEELVLQPQSSIQALSAASRRDLLLTSLGVVREGIEQLPGELRHASSEEWRSVAQDLVECGVQQAAVAWLGKPISETEGLIIPSWNSRFLADPSDEATDLGPEEGCNLADERLLVHAFIIYSLRFREGCIMKGGIANKETNIRIFAPALLQDMAVLVADGVATRLLQDVRQHTSPALKDKMTMKHLDWPPELHPRIKSTRSIERFCNQVLMWRWWDKNFTSVRAMYEDRFMLWGFDESGRLIQRPLPARRGWELSRLTGFRYHVSLALEAMDVGWPVLQAIAMKLKAAISWLLVTIIGHGLGLVFAGVRQSMGRNAGEESGSGKPHGGMKSESHKCKNQQGNEPLDTDSWQIGKGAFAN